MKKYFIYDLYNKRYYSFEIYQKRYPLLRKFINKGYLVEAIYDRDNVKQYVVKKCHE